MPGILCNFLQFFFESGEILEIVSDSWKTNIAPTTLPVSFRLKITLKISTIWKLNILIGFIFTEIAVHIPAINSHSQGILSDIREIWE